MATIDRRVFVYGAASAAGAAALPAGVWGGRSTGELEDWVGRDLVASIYRFQWRRDGCEADWEVGCRYCEVRFEREGRLYASDSFRSNVSASLADRVPRFFGIRYFYDLALFNTLVSNGHSAFRGLAGVVGDTLERATGELAVQLLVAAVERIVSEKAKHPDVRRWSRYFCADEDRPLLMASASGLPVGSVSGA